MIAIMNDGSRRNYTHPFHCGDRDCACRVPSKPGRHQSVLPRPSFSSQGTHKLPHEEPVISTIVAWRPSTGQRDGDVNVMAISGCSPLLSADIPSLVRCPISGVCLVIAIMNDGSRRNYTHPFHCGDRDCGCRVPSKPGRHRSVLPRPSFSSHGMHKLCHEEPHHHDCRGVAPLYRSA
jgi:hypothetical protein